MCCIKGLGSGVPPAGEAFLLERAHHLQHHRRGVLALAHGVVVREVDVAHVQHVL